MNALEANALLTHAANIDPRSKTQVERAEDWADRLHDVKLTDAMDALRIHQRDSTDPVMPAHILAILKRLFAERNAAAAKAARRALEKPATPRPSAEVEARLMRFGNGKDPVAYAQAERDYAAELDAAGHADAAASLWGHAPRAGSPMRGEGRDMVIPRGDR